MDGWMMAARRDGRMRETTSWGTTNPANLRNPYCGCPPFLTICDDGHSIALYAGFSRIGGHHERLPERLDSHCKRQQEHHPGLTLTGIYNVLETLRSGESLTAKEKSIHDQGLVAVLRQIHDELDEAVLEAYGWSDLWTAVGSEAPHRFGSHGVNVPPSLSRKPMATPHDPRKYHHHHRRAEWRG
jgi:hypothetical protein